MQVPEHYTEFGSAEAHPSGIRARIIADSLAPSGARLTTMEVRLPRFVLAELNTHRQFSRNSASSRAIPAAKQIEMVREDPFVPYKWYSNQKGMQVGEEMDLADLPTSGKIWTVDDEWRTHATEAADAAEILNDLDLHKSYVNRILEPFMWHTVIISATEWDNFFGQRCSPLAQPEIKIAADCMWTIYRDSPARPVAYAAYWYDAAGSPWHLPYIADHQEADWIEDDGYDPRSISAARCARVSYLTHDGKRDFSADQRLFEETLAKHGHWSPMEHVARPLELDAPNKGNFRGWKQLRHVMQMAEDGDIAKLDKGYVPDGEIVLL